MKEHSRISLPRIRAADFFSFLLWTQCSLFSDRSEADKQYAGKLNGPFTYGRVLRYVTEHMHVFGSAHLIAVEGQVNDKWCVDTLAKQPKLWKITWPQLARANQTPHPWLMLNICLINSSVSSQETLLQEEKCLYIHLRYKCIQWYMNEYILCKSHWGNVKEAVELSSCLIYPCVCAYLSIFCWFIKLIVPLDEVLFINNRHWVYEPLELLDSLAKQWLWMIRSLTEAGAKCKQK